MTAVLELDNVNYTFPGWPAVVRGVSLQVRAGQITCLLGRSGCGKTTLLKLAAGLLSPASGRVLVQGVPVVPDPARVGLVFQTPTLLDWLDVMDNVLLPVSLKRSVTAQDREAALALLNRLGLSALTGQRPWQLSGGQQSRVAIARALLLRPALLLMDEPFAALDALTREELQHDVLRMCSDHQTAVLFVTHDMSEAVMLGNEVLLMHEGALAYRQVRQDVQGDVEGQDSRRLPGWRYSPSFGAQAAALRAAMDQLAQAGDPAVTALEVRAV